MKNYDAMKDIFGECQSYKEIKINPLKLKDYEDFYFVRVLSLYHKKIEGNNIRKVSFIKFLIIYFIESEIIDAKKSAKDKITKEIKEKYVLLEYLYKLFGINECEEISLLKPYLEDFSSMINDCFKVLDFRKFISKICNVDYEHIRISMNITRMGVLVVYLNIEDKNLSDAEFENFRQIILKQNGVDFNYISEYDEESENKMKVLNKNNSAQATLSEQIITFSLILQKNPSELKEYTFYQLSELISRYGLLSDYNTYKALEAAGFIKFKDKSISHYLSKIDKKGRYDDLYVDNGEFKKDVLDKLTDANKK